MRKSFYDGNIEDKAITIKVKEYVRLSQDYNDTIGEWSANLIKLSLLQECYIVLYIWEILSRDIIVSMWKSRFIHVFVSYGCKSADDEMKIK